MQSIIHLNPIAMTPLHLRPSNWDEIIFEGRNKAYGAFDLRQSYPTHVRRAMGIAVLLFALMAAAPGIVRLLKPAPVYVPPKEQVLVLTDPTIFTPIEQAKPVVQPVPAPTSKVPMVALPTKVVRDELAKPEPVSTTVPPADALVGPTTTEGDGKIPFDGLEEPGTGTGGLGTTSAPAAPAPTPVFLTAERMPVFAGGEKAMLTFLQRNMHYPPMALREQIEGKVFVQFTVSASGDIVDVQVLKGLGYGTEEEALRVVRLMPRWQPGEQNGHPVAVRYTLPITFRFSQ